MTEQSQDSQDNAADGDENLSQSSQATVRPLRRCGCIVGILIWLIIMLVPCFFIALVVRQEIVITQGGAPNHVLRFWLINEADHRGVGMSSASVHPGSQDDGICVQTDVRFLLWMGESEPTAYCECYAPVDGELELTSASEGQCTP